MNVKREFRVETVQHGFALMIGNKQWLLESEQELAEAVVFRVALGSESQVTKRRMRKLLNMLTYGPHREYNKSRRNRGKGRNFYPMQSRRGHRNYGPQEEVNY